MSVSTLHDQLAYELRPWCRSASPAGTTARTRFGGGQAPDFALEILSEFTWRKDVRVNPQRYEQMGAHEYFLFDPNEFVKPRLQR